MGVLKDIGKAILPIAGPLIGGVVGGPVGAGIGGVLGGALGGALGSPGAGAATTFGLNELFGVDPASVVRGEEFSPLGFSGGGLTGKFDSDSVRIGSTPQRRGVLSNIRRTLGDRAKEFRNLAGQVKPGFGALTEAGVTAIQDQRRRTVGNLRENLARRRIAGSSFANDAITRTEATFAQQEAQFRARSFLQELDTFSKFIDESFKSDVDRFSSKLTEMNLQADIGLKLASGGTAALEASNRVQQQLLADIAIKEQQGRGGLLSGVGESLSDSLSSIFGDLFGSDSTTGTSGTITRSAGTGGTFVPAVGADPGFFK